MSIVNKDVLNKKELIVEISGRMKWDISPMTFWTWDKKFDFIKPFYRSKVAVLVKQSQVDGIIERLKKLHQKGLISIKVRV